MKLMEAIARVDSLKPNTYPTEQKLLWLAQLEAMVKTLVVGIRGEDPAFPEINENTDPQFRLYMPAPFDMAYLYWLEAQIHYANEEPELYNNAMLLFNAAFAQFRIHHHQNHSSGTLGRFRF